MSITRSGVEKHYPTRFLQADNGTLTLERPVSKEGEPDVPIAEGQPVVITFRHQYYRAVFTAAVTGVGSFRLSRQATTEAVTVDAPPTITCLDRRRYFRVPAPDVTPIRALVWPGGADRLDWARAAGKCSAGQVIEISVGGVRLGAFGQKPPTATGDRVGVEIDPGRRGPKIVTDAVLRHVGADDGGATLGLQFDDDQSMDNPVITKLVAELQRFWLRNRTQ